MKQHSTRAMRSIEGELSLHSMGRLFQLKYLAEQANQLLASLDVATATTELKAPVRSKQPYVLSRAATGSPRGEEARWERVIWREWHEREQNREFIPGLCTS